MELYYIQKGSRQTPDEDNNYEKYVLNIHYVELPFLYRYKISRHISFDAGLAYSVYFTDTEEFNGQEDVSRTEFNRHNLTFIAGVNYMFNPELRFFSEPTTA